jgi:hypothetical protein
MIFRYESPVSRAALLITTSNEVMERVRRRMAQTDRRLRWRPLISPRACVPGLLQRHRPISRGPLHLE